MVYCCRDTSKPTQKDIDSDSVMQTDRQIKGQTDKERERDG